MDTKPQPNSSPQPPKPNGPQQPVSLRPATETMAQGFEALSRSTRLRTAWPRLQRICPPRHERLWFIGGQPGNYKTQLMWNLAMDMALQRQRVLFVSLEQTPGETTLQAVARFSQIPIAAMERAQAKGGSGLTNEQEKGLELAARRLAETELFLRMHGADEHGRRLEDVMRSACRARFDAVFIDHIGMVGRDEAQELVALSRAIDRLRALTRGEVVKDYRPFVCATSPLKRDAAAGDEDMLPAITDFRGSSRLEYDADLAMILRKRKREKPDEENSDPDIVDAFVLKNRQGRCPVVLTFEAQGEICFVRERSPETPVPEHWSDK